MRGLACAAAGLPVGLLAGLVAAGPDPAALAAGAAAGALLLAGLAWLLGRRRPGGGAGSLAAAAQAGWLALPAAGLARLGLAPGPVALLVGVLAVLLVALVLGSRRRGAASSAAVAIRALGFALGGGLLLLVLAGFLAARGAPAPSFHEGTAAAIYAVDAQVPTRPLPVCGEGPARVETLLERGAHPRFSGEAEAVWFDAAAEDGRRQIHRLDVASGTVECLTCEEDGNNRNPSPSATGRAVVFDTDRHADRSAPCNTELHHLRVVAGGRSHPSRRITYAPGRDDHPILDPGGRGVVWSHGEGGRFRVVSAGFRSGHGAFLLADPVPILPGGADWSAPLAWSRDARGLAWLRGNPYGTGRADRIDPATARLEPLGDGVAPGGVDYSGDGGRLAVASAGPAGGLGRLPGFLGFALGALPSAPGAAGGGAPTRLRTGLAHVAPLHDVDLGAAADWGAPAGVALAPDGTWLVLAQRNDAGQERLLRVTLDCTIP